MHLIFSNVPRNFSGDLQSLKVRRERNKKKNAESS